MATNKKEDYISTNIRVLSVNDIYTTSPLPLASSNILDGAIKSINLPEKLLDPTPLDAQGRPNPRCGGEVPVVLPIGGLDILRTVFDELSTGTTIEGNPISSMNTLSFLNGDILGGSLFAEHFKGESMTELLNEINPTIIGIGNHEYDYGTPQFERLMGESKFTWLGENMTVREENKDSDGKLHQTRPHLNVPPCVIIDFIIREDENGEKDKNGKCNATVVGRYRNVILELLIANMLRGRCDIHDYTRFLRASAEKYQQIKETIPLQLEEEEVDSAIYFDSSTDPNCSPSVTISPSHSKKQQFYLYRLGIYSVCTQYTPNLSFPSPNTKFEKPEIYSLLLSLLLKTIGCHSIFLVSHLSLAGDMKIAQLSRKFTRMLQAHNTVNSSILPTSPHSSTKAILLQPHLSSSVTGDTTMELDSNTLHSRYTLIDTIFGGHEHEPIIMQLSEFEYSGVVVNESGGDVAKGTPHGGDAQPKVVDPYELHDHHEDDDDDHKEILPPSLEYIASLRAPMSGYIHRENIQYDPYDGPAVIKAGMNNQYTAVVDYTIYIPKKSCINHPTLSSSSSSIPTLTTTDNVIEQVIDNPNSTTPLDLRLKTGLSTTSPDEVCLRDKFNSTILFNDNEYFITLHKDISITFNIIKHLITTTLLAQNSLKKTTPGDFLEEVFKPFKETPIYLTYLHDILMQVKGENGDTYNTSTPQSALPFSELPISPPQTPSSSLLLSNPVSPAVSVATTTFSQQLLPQAELFDFSTIHSSLILPQYQDVLSRIHNPSKYQDLLQLYNSVSHQEFQQHLQEQHITASGGPFSPSHLNSSSLNLHPEDTEAKSLRPLHIAVPCLEIAPSSISTSSDVSSTNANLNTSNLNTSNDFNIDDKELLLHSQMYLKNALTNGIIPIPIPHQTDFALSPLHYIQHYHDLHVNPLLNATQYVDDTFTTQEKNSCDRLDITPDNNSNAVVTTTPQHSLVKSSDTSLQRLHYLHPKTNQPLIHHPSHIYSKMTMFMIPNIQLPGFFPSQFKKGCQNTVQVQPTNCTPIPSHICKINFATHNPSHQIVTKWSTQLQLDIAQGRDLEQIYCTLESSFDTRSQYGRTQGGVSGPNAIADALEWFGSRTSQRIIEFQEELHQFVQNECNGNSDLDTLDAADLPLPPDSCPIEWSDLTDILIPLKHKIKGVISCINGGFLRGDKYYAKGSNLTLGDFLSELPFPKTALHALIFGKDLIRTINQQLVLLPTATGAFPHWSSNVSIEYTPSALSPESPYKPLAGCADGNDTFKLGHRHYEDPSNPFYVRGSNTNSNSNSGSNNAELSHTPNAPDVPKRVISILIDGKPIDPEGLYFITSTQFILWGGDGLTSTLRSRLVPHINQDKRWKVIGEIALEYFSNLKCQANTENDPNFVLHYDSTKRVTMHRKE